MKKISLAQWKQIVEIIFSLIGVIKKKKCEHEKPEKEEPSK
jgi:hypothetical protein